MTPQIELITLGAGGTVERAWHRGPQRGVAPTAAALGRALGETVADAVLCLDAAFPLPDDALLERLIDGPSDAWHGGLALGLEGQPTAWDRVDPLSMFSARLDPTIEATSWRLSLRALLVRRAVLDQLGGPASGFDTMAGAGLDLGLRWIRAGALLRHIPDLVPTDATPEVLPTFRDGLRLVTRHRGRVWGGWALQRSVVTREVGLVQAARSALELRRVAIEPVSHYEPPVVPGRDLGSTERTVSVVLPTIDRYTYLETVLHQLAAQTVAPHQVFIVDQTPMDRRRDDLTAIEPDLPVTVIGLPEPGQCTARNAAVRQATGEMLLFIDDDDEIGADLLSDHLRRLTDGIDASCGGVDDATAGPPPEGFRHRRASHTFPTNNTMLRREALRRSGLFDPAYDRGPRADHDLGMRLHLAGALLVYDPAVLVFHHHAQAGGLRTHGARQITRASSRRSLTERNLPAVTQLYLGRRYFSVPQRREGRWVAIMTTLRGEGTASLRLARAVVQLGLLPSTLRALRNAERLADIHYAARPPIPTLPAVVPEPGAT